MLTVAIFGAAGGVGSATAAALIDRGFADRLMLIDVDTRLLAVLHMDLRLLSGAVGRTEVVVAGPGQAALADVIVVAAGVAHRDGAPRSALAGDNLQVLDGLLRVLPHGWPGALVIATNPVDVLCTWARQVCPEATVMGYARNDSLRLAQAVADVLGCHPGQVEAWALGEHGPGMVALFDRLRVDGRPVRLSEAQRDDALARSIGWYDEWQRHQTGRTSMWTTSRGLGDLVAAYLAPSTRVEPVCAPIRGSYGIDEEICLGVPVLLGHRGARTLRWDLTPAQSAGMAAAARTVSEAIEILRRTCRPAPTAAVPAIATGPP